MTRTSPTVSLGVHVDPVDRVSSRAEQPGPSTKVPVIRGKVLTYFYDVTWTRMKCQWIPVMDCDLVDFTLSLHHWCTDGPGIFGLSHSAQLAYCAALT